MHWAIPLTLAGCFVLVGGGAVLVLARHVVRTGRWSWRREDDEAAPEPAKVCPSCARRYGAEAQFCATDASPLSWLEGEVGDVKLSCRRCDVVYDAGLRFCPVDAEELVRLDPADTEQHRHVQVRPGSDMICPVCAARYEVAANFCGRDGTRLCPLH